MPRVIASGCSSASTVAQAAVKYAMEGREEKAMKGEEEEDATDWLQQTPA